MRKEVSVTVCGTERHDNVSSFSRLQLSDVQEVGPRVLVSGTVVPGDIASSLMRYLRLRRRAAVMSGLLFVTTKGTPYVVRALRRSP